MSPKTACLFRTAFTSPYVPQHPGGIWRRGSVLFVMLFCFNLFLSKSCPHKGRTVRFQILLTRQLPANCDCLPSKCHRLPSNCHRLPCNCHRCIRLPLPMAFITYCPLSNPPYLLTPSVGPKC